MIPKIIHFMWLDKKDPYSIGYPDKFTGNLQKWKTLNPDAKIVLWNYKDIEREFPEYMQYLNKIPAWISKCDMARFFVLQKYGGIYSDLDFTPLKTLDSSVWNRDILIIYEPRQHMEREQKGLLFNGFVGSIPNHPFINGWIQRMIYYTENQESIWKVSKTTGTESFYNYYLENPTIDIDPADTCKFIPLFTDTKLIPTFFPRPECESVEPFCYTTWVEGSKWSFSEFFRITGQFLPYIIASVLIVFMLYYKRK